MVYVMARIGRQLKVYENVRRSCTMKIRRVIFVVMIFLACLFMATAEAQQYTVTKVVVIAKPSTYAGPCPATIEFLATIFVSRPARVEYRWERSDGVMGPRESVDIRSAGKGVTTTWKVGTPRRTFTGWERLHVLAPASMISNQAAVQIKCN